MNLFFVDSKNGFSIKGNQKLYLTSDGGESWENIEFDRKFYYFIEVEGEHFAVTEKVDL